MLKKISIPIIILLTNLQIAFADPAPSATETGSDKLDGAIWWVGQGAKVVGIIALIFGFWQLAMSFADDEPGNRNKALIFLACGLILFWTPNILVLLMHWNIIDPSKW